MNVARIYWSSGSLMGQYSATYSRWNISSVYLMYTSIFPAPSSYFSHFISSSYFYVSLALRFQLYLSSGIDFAFHLCIYLYLWVYILLYLYLWIALSAIISHHFLCFFVSLSLSLHPLFLSSESQPYES